MAEGASPRRIAVKVLERIENDGAFANLVLNATLEKSKLDSRDRAFVTEMVYGTTRMRRACDYTRRSKIWINWKKRFNQFCKLF